MTVPTRRQNMPTYEYLDLQITLRCNAACSNCIKFCNLQRVTGLDYSQSDLTRGQIAAFINDVRTAGVTIDNLVVTGGEPLLHSEVVDFVHTLRDALLDSGHVRRVLLNTNLRQAVPKPLLPYAVNYSRPEESERIHDAVFVHPDDHGGPVRFADCRHYRKYRVVCNYQGYSLCCAGDGYIRLFALEHLIVDHLPADYQGFPLASMDDVCRNCPFGGSPPKQADVGCPVSPIYAEQGKQNRAGRSIAKRLWSIPN